MQGTQHQKIVASRQTDGQTFITPHKLPPTDAHFFFLCVHRVLGRRRIPLSLKGCQITGLLKGYKLKIITLVTKDFKRF